MNILQINAQFSKRLNQQKLKTKYFRSQTDIILNDLINEIYQQQKRKSIIKQFNMNIMKAPHK